jgi:trehalose synthase-fused probable maltokinase
MASKRRPSSEPADVSAAAALAAAAEGLPTYLPRQRWFGAKTRPVTAAAPVDYVAVPGTRGLLALFRLEIVGRAPETYLVPLLTDRRQDATPIADALDDPAFCAALVEQARAGAALPGQAGTFRFVATPVLAELLPEPARETARVGAEQSNSSVVVGGRAILKVFRHLEPGPNPELELTEFLTRATAFREAPRLCAFVSYETPGAETTVLATLHELIPKASDAWAAVLERLHDYYTAAVGDESQAPDSAFARALAAADAKDAGRLGATTGRLHVALASAPAEAPLARRPVSAHDVAEWEAGMVEHLDEAVRALGRAGDAVPPDARPLADWLRDATPTLRDAFAALRVLEAEPVDKIRVHGDYHLGQVLRAGDAFVVVDFEGEPARPLAERSAPTCALKDVAGMLRSFGYAARVALGRAAESRPKDPRAVDHLEPWADAWEEGVRAAFLEGYLAETWARQVSFLPRRKEALEALVRTFELDKAVYELQYELDHRPSWVKIPLEGLKRTAEPSAPAPTAPRPGEGPFSFVACVELREFVGVRAEDERQLAELIEQVPLDSIYYHTHSFFLRHRFVAGPYPNDFATWAALHVRDQILGERLAMVDPALFPDLEALRQELVATVDDHLRSLQIVPRIVSGEPFEFVRSRIVEIPTGVETRTLAELRQALLEVDVSAIYFHLVEARMRLGRGQNDFAAWLEHALGLGELATRVRAINPYGGSLERTRARLIQLCDEALVQGTSR